MATLYFMRDALSDNWKGKSVVPVVDQFGYRTGEGHGHEKAFRVDGFEDHQSSNPLIVHAYNSDTYLRMRKLFEEGTLAIGDKFIFGSIPENSELDSLWARQGNTVDGLQLKFTTLDSVFATVEDEAMILDFANNVQGGRWVAQPTQKYRYDNSGTNAFNGENEIMWLAAEVATLPAEWFDECNPCDALPQFQARLHYNDSCLNPGMGACAPQDVYDAYQAGIEVFETGGGSVVIFDDIEVDKSCGGHGSC